LEAFDEPRVVENVLLDGGKLVTEKDMEVRSCGGSMVLRKSESRKLAPLKGNALNKTARCVPFRTTYEEKIAPRQVAKKTSTIIQKLKYSAEIYLVGAS
jgi:hypothetical protein